MNKPVNESTSAALRQELEKTIHESARLEILVYLYLVEQADFVYLLHQTGLSKGNLSSHLAKLEEAGYVKIEKGYADKIPRTLLSLTAEGRQSLEIYKQSINRLLQVIR